MTAQSAAAENFTDDPVWQAGVDLLRRTGIREFQIRYSDDVLPVVWIAVARWQFEKGVPVADGGRTRWDAGSALTPVKAMLRLLDHALDGGLCKHCSRPSGVTTDIDEMPMEQFICWYQFDPELKTFRRGCEGATS